MLKKFVVLFPLLLVVCFPGCFLEHAIFSQVFEDCSPGFVFVLIFLIALLSVLVVRKR